MLSVSGMVEEWIYNLVKDWEDVRMIYEMNEGRISRGRTTQSHSKFEAERLQSLEDLWSTKNRQAWMKEPQSSTKLLLRKFSSKMNVLEA